MGCGGSVHGPRNTPGPTQEPVQKISIQPPPVRASTDESLGRAPWTALPPEGQGYRTTVVSITSQDLSGGKHPLLDLVAACEAASLPDATQDAVVRAAQDVGATECAHLLIGGMFAEVSKRANLKAFEADRLKNEIKSMVDGEEDTFPVHGEVSPLAAYASPEAARLGLRAPPQHATLRVQGLGGPNRLVFIRHGESEANVDRGITVWVPDHDLHLTPKGRTQALSAGVRLRELLGEDLAKTNFTVSPYVRARETLNGILNAWPTANAQGVQALQDVRIREQEFGNFDRPDISQLHKEKSAFGAFYYRFPDGESPADCYDRGTSFLENMVRTWDPNHHTCVVVSHGMMIMVMLMRLLGYAVDEFDTLGGIENCEFVVLERASSSRFYDLAFTWNDVGKETQLRRIVPRRGPPKVWDGNPEAGPMSSKVRKSVVEVVNLAHLRSSLASGQQHTPLRPTGPIYESTASG